MFNRKYKEDYKDIVNKIEIKVDTGHFEDMTDVEYQVLLIMFSACIFIPCVSLALDIANLVTHYEFIAIYEFLITLFFIINLAFIVFFIFIFIRSLMRKKMYHKKKLSKYYYKGLKDEEFRQAANITNFEIKEHVQYPGNRLKYFYNNVDITTEIKNCNNAIEQLKLIHEKTVKL